MAVADMYAPERAVNRLNSDYFTNAKITRKHVLLKEVNGKAIGHFGFFRKQFLETFGKLSVEWMSKQ